MFVFKLSNVWNFIILFEFTLITATDNNNTDQNSQQTSTNINTITNQISTIEISNEGSLIIFDFKIYFNNSYFKSIFKRLNKHIDFKR